MLVAHALPNCLPCVCRLAVMKALLEWRHQAPTAPDTLACYPFLRDDPFMMEAAPHVFFAGCQPEFASEEVHGELSMKVKAQG